MPSTRHSRQRQLVLEELLQVKSHPTADELHRLVRRRLPRISLATVYRNLELLAAQGTISRLALAGHQRRYDGRAEEHAHIRCLRCDAVGDVEIAARQTPLDEVQAATDYRVTGQRVEFMGECAACQGTSGQADSEPRGIRLR